MKDININDENQNISSAGPDNIMMWDSSLWAQQFKEASDSKDSFRLHMLRTDVFHSTLQIVGRGCYHAQSGEVVRLDVNNDIALQSKFYSAEINTHGLRGSFDTRIYAVNDDCLAYARRLVETDSDVCVLNMANRRNPGGGVLNGAGAQEEYLFRCTDYYRSLYQYIDYSGMYGIMRAPHSYPLDRNYGGIFSPSVTVFRGLEEEGYPLLSQPWKVNMVAVPAVSNPRCISIEGVIRIAPDLISGVKNKMRTVLRIAAINGQKTLVLGALGCGAFRNPPLHTAELFKEVIGEPEFAGVFRRICFVIKEDHNSRGEGNFKPFAQVFGTE